MDQLFTSESVASGHPDKICDQVSDAIVDAALSQDPTSRVAVETLVTAGRVVLAGEVTTPKTLPYTAIARDVIASLGYTDDAYGFTSRSPISVYIHEQSPDIAVGVDDGGAGDQGMMFGYASDETPEYMPLPIMLAHRMAAAMDSARTGGAIPELRPDGKSEVTVAYRNGAPVSVTRVVLAVPHDPSLAKDRLTDSLYDTVVLPVIRSYCIKPPKKQDLIVNGTGKWEIGGPKSDTGVTGRKIIVDTYGGYARHGGGAFSGKDPTKVDRSGAYACRFIAKNIVARRYASRAEVRVAYAIGYREPIAFAIECFGTNTVDNAKIYRFARQLMDLSVPGIIRGLSLSRPIYRKTAAYGHFGRDGFPWEAVVE